jgi:beta-carotene hydroxylase
MPALTNPTRYISPTDAAAPSHHEAIRIARGHEPAVAWPTVRMALVVVSGYWGVAYLAASGALALWWAIPLNIFFAYACYTPAHEACHGNVVDKNHRLAWLNNVVGVFSASPLLHNFHMHQLSHLAHHAHTNDPAKDPDQWMAVRGIWPFIWRSFTLVLVHYKWEIALCLARADGKRRIVLAIVQNLLWIGIVAWLAVLFDATATLLATVLSTWIGSAALAVAFDWLPHHPHTSRERWEHTRVILFPRVVQRTFDALLFGQTYHLVHHLYPRIPFYQYKSVFEKLRSFFEQNGAQIRKAQTGIH